MPKSKLRKGRGSGPRPTVYKLDPPECLRQIGHGEVVGHKAKVMADFLLRTANFEGVAPTHIQEFLDSGVEHWPPETVKDIILLARAAYPKTKAGPDGNEREPASVEAAGVTDQQGARGALSGTGQ